VVAQTARYTVNIDMVHEKMRVIMHWMLLFDVVAANVIIAIIDMDIQKKSMRYDRYDGVSNNGGTRSNRTSQISGEPTPVGSHFLITFAKWVSLHN
jgi:hypothetical protein